MYENELYHHGVKGMRWGHRKAQPVSGSRGRMQSAKADYKSAKKAYNKSFNKAYNYSGRHPISQFAGSKKVKAESDARWNQAYKDAERMNSTKSKYKQEKKAYKQTDEYKAKRAKYIKTGAAVVAVAGTIAVASLAKKEMRNYINGGMRWMDDNAPRLDYWYARAGIEGRSMQSTRDLIESTRNMHKALNNHGVDVSRLKRTGHWG